MVTELRYEYRVWADRPVAAGWAVRAAGREAGGASSHETYLVTPSRLGVNAKIRRATLDVKVRREARRGLELWEPMLEAGFPLPAGLVAARVLPLLGEEREALDADEYGEERFLAEVAAPLPGVAVLAVQKERAFFDYGGCRVEESLVTVAGTRLHTLCVEDEDPDRVREVAAELGIDAVPAAGYPEALTAELGLRDRRA